MTDYACAAGDCTRLAQCDALGVCRWDVPADLGGSMAAPPPSPIGVGDLQSQAPGSGARYNLGKPPMETIPVWIIAAGHGVKFGAPTEQVEAYDLLHHLARWQRGERSMCEVLPWCAPEAWEEAAQVFHHVTTRPVKPYPMWNWAKGMPWSVPTACAVRHLLAILRGEDLDPETGLPHRGHAMCNLIMLAQYEKTYREGDDRPAFLRSTT
jgi:hypothetical protein